MVNRNHHATRHANDADIDFEIMSDSSPLRGYYNVAPMELLIPLGRGVAVSRLCSKNRRGEIVMKISLRWSYHFIPLGEGCHAERDGVGSLRQIRSEGAITPTPIPV